MAKTAQAAATGTAFTSLREKTSPATKRMAGALLAAVATPSVLAALDNQDETVTQAIGSGLITAGGAVGGGYVGYRSNHFANDNAKEAFVRDALTDLKVKSQQIAAEAGPAAGVEYFAKAKGQLMQSLEGIDPKRANVFNKSMREIPELGDIVADLDLLRKTPREVAGMTRGAALGSLAAALPAYLAMRGGEKE